MTERRRLPGAQVGFVLVALAGCSPAVATLAGAIDTQAPQSEILSGPVGGSVTAAVGAEFVFAAKVVGSTFECRHNGQGFSACESPVVLDGLEDGQHVFQVRARGPAPNQAPTRAVTRRWRVDSEGGEWLTMVVDGPQDTGRYNSIAVVSGRPVIFYYEDTPDDLAFAYPMVDRPISSDDWRIYAVDVGSFSGAGTSTAVLADGLLAVAYSGDERLRLAVAAGPFPTSANDWRTQLVDAVPRAEQAIALAVVEGVPVIAYQDWDAGEVKFARGLVASPGVTSDWQIHSFGTADPHVEGLGMAILDGRPAVAFVSMNPFTLNFAHATKPLPERAEDWGLHVIHEIDAGQVSMAVIGGRPALCYQGIEEDDLWFAMAKSESPESGGDWDIHVVDGAGDMGRGCALAVWRGRAVVTYFDLTKGQLKIAVARVPFPAAISDWRIEVVDVDQGTTDGDTSMVVLPSGELAIAYYDGNADDLKFAIGRPGEG